MGLVSVLPVATDNPVLNRQLSHCRFEVDTDTGAVRWYRDALTGKEREPQTFALPGSSAAGPVLQTIVYARLPVMDRASVLQRNDRLEKLWLVDEHDHVIGFSGAVPALHDVFTVGAMAPLTDAGVGLVDRTFDTVYDAKSSYTGAVPYWWLRSRRTAPVAIFVILLVVIALIVLATQL